MRLSAKLPLLVIGAVAATGGIAGAIAVRSTRESVRAQALDANRHSLAAYASAVDSYLRQAASLLEVTAAASGDRPGDLAVERGRARRLLEHSGVFESVALLDRTGRVLVLEPEAAGAGSVRDDWSFLRWWPDATAGTRTAVSDLHVSPVTQNPSVAIAAPVTGRAGPAGPAGPAGEVSAVWAGGLRLDTLSALARAGNDVSSYGLLTDRQGLVIAHQAKPNFVAYQTDFRADPPVARALAGQTGSGTWRNPVDGERKIGAYQPLAGSGWAAVYASRLDTALAPARRVGAEIAGVAMGLVLVIGLGGLAATRRLTAPIRRLRDAADRAGAGDLDTRLDVAGSDEIAGLARRFNAMLDALAARDGMLRRQAATLEQSNHELESFTYAVSHDLRTPLRAIDGFSKIILEEYGDAVDGAGRAHLTRIRAGAQRMGGLIDDLLGLSRVGQTEIVAAPVDLSALAAEVVAELRDNEPARAVTVTVAPGLAAAGDRRLLRILLANLVGNAWKFTAATPGARIDVGPLPDGGGVFVADNGAGFDMAYAGKLFAPFQRLHAAGEFPGNGIGLATAQRIVHRHGGQIWADAAVGRGATFSFTLPGPEGPPPAEPPAASRSLITVSGANP